MEKVCVFPFYRFIKNLALGTKILFLLSCTLANLPEPIPFIERSTSQEFNTPDEAALNWSLIFNDSSKARNREVSTYIVETERGKYHT